MDQIIPREAIRKVYIHNGRRHPFWEGVGYGALFGLVWGGLASFGPKSESPGDARVVWERWNAGEIVLGGLAAGIAVGGTIGLLVKVDRWKEIKPSHWEKTLGGQQSAVSVKAGLALKF